MFIKYEEVKPKYETSFYIFAIIMIIVTLTLGTLLYVQKCTKFVDIRDWRPGGRLLWTYTANKDFNYARKANVSVEHVNCRAKTRGEYEYANNNVICTNTTVDVFKVIECGNHNDSELTFLYIYAFGWISKEVIDTNDVRIVQNICTQHLQTELSSQIGVFESCAETDTKALTLLIAVVNLVAICKFLYIRFIRKCCKNYNNVLRVHPKPI